MLPANSSVDAYVDRLVAEAPPLSAAQRDAISAAFARLRPRKREAA